MTETALQPQPTQKTDGAAGPPVPANTPGAPNSALKEAAAAGDGVNPNHPARATDVRVVDADAGVVTGTRKRIAVCGFASSSRPLIPVNDPAWEVWGLNQLYRHVTRADRWFDIHHNWNEEVVPDTDHRGWIRDCGIPVYMMARHPDLPTSVRYPVERVMDVGGDYFTSTVAYMVALAIDEIEGRVDAQLAAEISGLKRADFDRFRRSPLEVVRRTRQLYEQYMIGLFGIDLVVGEEYFWQKACAEFWLGIACGRGIQVFIPPQSALCKQMYRYGYESEPNSLVKLSEVVAHGDRLAKERDELIKALYLHDGALQADEYWKQLIELRSRGAHVG